MLQIKKPFKTGFSSVKKKIKNHEVQIFTALTAVSGQFVEVSHKQSKHPKHS